MEMSKSRLSRDVVSLGAEECRARVDVDVGNGIGKERG